MILVEGRPLAGNKKLDTETFLLSLGLEWEEGLETTFNLVENDRICATGSRQANILKCIGVSPDYQGEGVSATIITELVKDAFHHGITHLFLYTKPENRQMFSGYGFYEIASTKDVTLMENQKDGIKNYLRGLPVMSGSGDVAAIVANCNPFTNGHLYLIEEAAARCEFLYLFILSEDKSEFSSAERMHLVRQGTAHIDRLAVYPTGDYLISSATFPQYFLKEKQSAHLVQCELDLNIFTAYFAEHFGIKRRFVGTEPYSAVTAEYNRQMKALLPGKGIEVVELLRKEIGGEAVSASRVRRLMQEHDLEAIRALVPDSTYRFLENRMML